MHPKMPEMFTTIQHEFLSNMRLAYDVILLLLLPLIFFMLMVLTLKNQQKGCNAPSVRSPVVDVKKMKPDHWLGVVLCVPFSVLTSKR